ncbi:MAG TPA: hypothetical protein VGH07_07945 [Chthoniobacterales bacterium]|jgi:hypothetical protein
MAQRHQLTDAPALKGLVDAAIEIADARRQILQRMRTALERGDITEALKFARELCGLEEKVSSRIAPNLN